MSKIVLVEDTPADALLAMQTLKRNNPNHQITYFDEGKGLFEFLNEDETNELPNLILLDMHLPIMSGLDILRKLKRNNRYKSIPVIMLTSSRQERDIIEAYELGALSYIVKPFNPTKVKDALSNLNELNNNANSPLDN